MENYFSVAGKKILITGSSRGLGLIFARGLAAHGAHVILNGRNPERLESASNELKTAGYSVSAAVFNVADEEEVTSAIGKIESELGGIDVVINNAGMQFRKPLEDFPLEKWKELLEINLTGVFVVSKAVAKYMIQRKQGKIINICSLQSDLGRNTIAPYAASKGGLKMFTRAMAVDWAAHNIQVNAIGPGYFKTEMTQPLVDDKSFDEWLKNRTPAHRWGDPEELLGAIYFFASEASNFVNGQILYVDGGIIAAI